LKGGHQQPVAVLFVSILERLLLLLLVKILSLRKPEIVNIARNMLRRLRLIFGIIKVLMNSIERIALNTIVNIAEPIQSGMLRTSTTAEHVSSKQEVLSPLKSG